MKKKVIIWICIASLCLGVVLFKPKTLRADFWGGDLPLLAGILAQAIQQVATLTQVLGRARDTVSLLEEMNRGVKEMLKLAETAHIPLPKQVYDNAKRIDQATQEAQRVYGIVSEKSPKYTQNNYRTGVEGLHLSHDAFEYSTFLDIQGAKVKSAAIIANQANATRLTAETLGVVLHAVSHTNRIEAKQLELSSTKRLEDSAKENAEYESFIETHRLIQSDMKKKGFRSLNSIGGEYE